MRRELSAYLNDILEAAIAIQEATATEDETTYGTNRLVRSSVEREFIIIGEALKVIGTRSGVVTPLRRTARLMAHR